MENQSKFLVLMTLSTRNFIT